MVEAAIAEIDAGAGNGKERALASLALAFSGDPIMRWIFPDADEFLEHFPHFAALYGGAAFETGEAYRIEGHAGVALWSPPGTHADEEAVAAVLADAIPEARHDEVFSSFEAADDYEPKEAHWYLALLGVDPGRQGKGLGGQLLAHTLAKCDAQHMPAYLQSSNPANVSLYRRHGFEPLGTVMIGGQPLLTPMLRPAR